MRKIGFWAENEQSKEQKNETTQFKTEKTEAKESVVRVYFPARGFACSYYNDKFDLKKGDGVYVDGKLEGLLGFITEVSYCFKIKLSEYKRVIIALTRRFAASSICSATSLQPLTKT